MSQSKQKLCKQKQNCQSFLAGRSCGFDHVICKFNQTCRDKDKCIFYHKPKQSFQSSKAETQCKFGLRCNKLPLGTCPFKHTQQRNNYSNDKQSHFNAQKKSNPLEKNICRFGEKCLRANCRFQHPQRNQEYKNNETQQKENIFSNHQITIQHNNNQTIRKEISGFLQSSCLDFLLRNQCQARGGVCKNSHEFTSKNSIKRVFYTTEFPKQKNSSIRMFRHVQGQRSSGQLNEPIYLLNQKNTIDFKKLISSEKLYENIRGLGNIPQKFYLRSVCKDLFKTPNDIIGVDCITLGTKQLIVFICEGKINIYNLMTGKINFIDLIDKSIQNRLISCVRITDQVMLICTALDQLKQIKYFRQREEFKEVVLKQLPKYKYKIFKQTNGHLFGEHIFFGITNCEKKIVFFNSYLDYNQISSGERNFFDADIGVIKNIPICLISSFSNSTKSEIIALNLLNFDELSLQTVLASEFNQFFRKLLITQQHLLIQIANSGLTIYKLGQFNKLIGLIPLNNPIIDLSGDDKGNMLLLQNVENNSLGSLSLFKIKKI